MALPPGLTNREVIDALMRLVTVGASIAAEGFDAGDMGVELLALADEIAAEPGLARDVLSLQAMYLGHAMASLADRAGRPVAEVLQTWALAMHGVS